MRAEARTESGFNLVRSDSNALHGAARVDDFRSVHAESSYPLGGTRVESLADALYEGEAAFGTLRGRAESGAIAGTAFTHLTLRWDDRFHVVSGGLPFGTPVDLRYTLTLESALFASQSCGGIGPPGPAIAAAVGWNGAAGILSHRACGTSDPGSLETLIHTTVGALLDLSGELDVGTSVGSSAFSRPHNTAIADAFHTAHFYIDPVGMDFSYTTDSGVSYVSPRPPTSVPEPPTWLLGIGALAVWRASARRPTRAS